MKGVSTLSPHEIRVLHSERLKWEIEMLNGELICNLVNWFVSTDMF